MPGRGTGARWPARRCLEGSLQGHAATATPNLLRLSPHSPALGALLTRVCPPGPSWSPTPARLSTSHFPDKLWDSKLPPARLPSDRPLHTVSPSLVPSGQGTQALLLPHIPASLEASPEQSMATANAHRPHGRPAIPGGHVDSC